MQVEDDDRIEKDEFANFDTEKYRTQVFSMFGGELKTVELQFVPEMLDDIYDKFGEEVRISSCGDTYKVGVPIQISPTFFAWVVGSRGKVRIISPCSVCESFQSFVDEIKSKY